MKCAAGEKPVVVFSHVSGGLDQTLKRILDEGGVPFLQGTRESLCAIDHLLTYAKFREKNIGRTSAGRISPQNLPPFALRSVRQCLSY